MTYVQHSYYIITRLVAVLVGHLVCDVIFNCYFYLFISSIVCPDVRNERVRRRSIASPTNGRHR